ncbi:plasmid mobilization protein, partial [Clostridium butyricum]
MQRKREKQIKFYADEKEFQQIKKKIERSKLSQQDYLLK